MCHQCKRMPGSFQISSPHKRRQRGRVVRAPDLKSGGLGFKSRSCRWLELFLGSPKFNSSAALVNSQLVCLLPVGSFNHVIFNLKLFLCDV